MKTQRVIIAVLSILVVILAFLAFSNRKKSEEMPPPNTSAALVQTNTLEMWRTNTLDRWLTNTVVMTNTVLQPVTNEVVKEVPAKLTTNERDAAIVGYKLLHAPKIENRADVLYKLGPVAVDVEVDPATAVLLGQNSDGIKKEVESVLSSRNVPVSPQSRHHVRVGLSALWRMSDPRVALVSCTLQLRELTVVERQNDLIGCTSILWGTSKSRFVRTINMAEGAIECTKDPVDTFCDDYQQAKQDEKQIESQLPKPPAEFLSGAR